MILCDGLTADSTGRTIPELKRAAEVDLQHPDGPDHNPGPRRPGKWHHLSTISGQAGRLTPFAGGRDNRSPLMRLLEDTAAEGDLAAVVVPRPAGLIPLAQRALVCLRDGLTADSTGRTIPE